MQDKQSQENVDEIIRIIRGVKRHLVEPEGCVHSLDFIINEALGNENNNGKD